MVGVHQTVAEWEEVILPPAKAKRYGSAGEGVPPEDAAEVTPPATAPKLKRYYSTGEEVSAEDLALVERAEKHLFGAVVGGEGWEWRGEGEEGGGVKVEWDDEVVWEMEKMGEKRGLLSWIKGLVCGTEAAAKEDEEERASTTDWLGRPPLPPLTGPVDDEAAASKFVWKAPEVVEMEKRRFLTLTHFDGKSPADFELHGLQRVGVGAVTNVFFANFVSRYAGVHSLFVSFNRGKSIWDGFRIYIPDTNYT